MADCFSLLKIRKLREYQPVSLPVDVPGRFAFFDGRSWTNCTMSHVLYEPMLIVVSFSAPQNPALENKLRIYSLENPNQVAAELSLQFKEQIENGIYLFAVTQARLEISGLRELYLRRIYRAGLKKGANFLTVYNFDIYKKLAALFCFPKQVWLLSIPSENGDSHFPVDLCAIAGDTIVIGVRNSNDAMSKLLPGGIFYLSEAAAQDYRKIYALGKFSTASTPTHSLVAQTDFAFPEVVCSYRKLTLSRKLTFAKQSLYLAKTQDSTVADASKTRLYHIHKIWLMRYFNYDKVETQTA